MNIIGDIEGKTAILVDDMIDTAGTITNAANAIKQLGARESMPALRIRCCPALQFRESRIPRSSRWFC